MEIAKTLHSSQYAVKMHHRISVLELGSFGLSLGKINRWSMKITFRSGLGFKQRQ